jgi:hypothetical protein
MKSHFDIAVERLHYWQYGDEPTNFTSQLFSLMQKADKENFAKLADAFPEEANALLLWRASSDPDAFFEAHGLPAYRKKFSSTP